MDKQEPVVMERWPGFTEQSWAQRFAELDRRYDRLGEQMRTALIDLSARANRPADDGLAVATLSPLANAAYAIAGLVTGEDWSLDVAKASVVIRQYGEACVATALRAQSDAEVEREALREALRVFVGCAVPVAAEINPRGHNWCEAYLDQALPIAIDALERGEHRKNGV